MVGALESCLSMSLSLTQLIWVLTSSHIESIVKSFRDDIMGNPPSLSQLIGVLISFGHKVGTVEAFKDDVMGKPLLLSSLMSSEEK